MSKNLAGTMGHFLILYREHFLPFSRKLQSTRSERITMKILRLSFTIFILLQILTIAFALKNICKYRGKQMTPGQSIRDCYSIVTCKTGGVIARRDSCAEYICEHKLLGYKHFNHRKRYPECCGGPTCDDIYKIYLYKP